MSGHINDVHYDDPRAAKVAGRYLGRGADDDTPHSVVHGAILIEAKSIDESNAIMAAWPQIMSAVSGMVAGIVGSKGGT